MYKSKKMLNLNNKKIKTSKGIKHGQTYSKFKCMSPPVYLCAKKIPKNIKIFFLIYYNCDEITEMKMSYFVLCITL